MHPRHQTQVIDCVSRSVEGQPGHSLLQNAMPDDEEAEGLFKADAVNEEDSLVFGGFAFLPVSLGPAGDCPCKD